MRKFTKIIVALFAFILLFLLTTVLGAKYQAIKIANCYIDNVDKVIELSKKILSDTTFEKEGEYRLYFNNDCVNADLYDRFDIVEHKKIKSIEVSQDYKEFFDQEWVNKKTIIQVNTFVKNEYYNSSKSVVFKNDYMCGNWTFWVYYGDQTAFPLCPYDSSADNIHKLTDDLYYDYGKY